MPARILQKDEKLLRAKAAPLAISDIKSQKIQELLKTMRETLANEYDGVGLAAPQIGHSLRIFIVSELAFRQGRKLVSDAATEKREPLVYINPEIVASSKDQKSVDEGCLSVRPLFGKVKRATRVKIRAYNEHGELFERGASGLLAQIYQHEMDHLEGILFIDKAKDVREMPPYVPESHDQA